MSALLEIVEDIGIRQQLIEVFSDEENGTPNNISKFGCLALAKKGAVVWNAWRKAFPVIEHELFVNDYKNIANFGGLDISGIKFSGFDFDDGANFVCTNFLDDISFNKCNFGKNTTFSQARFSKEALFIRSRFKDVDFSETEFEVTHLRIAVVRFEEVDFDGGVSFIRAKFRTNLEFNKVNFKGIVFFLGTIFPLTTEFVQVHFHELVDFSGFEWSNFNVVKNDTDFETFKKSSEILNQAPNNFLKIKFMGCRFTDKSNFSNRNFKSTTVFGKFKAGGSEILTVFADAPKFHNCELYQDTSFDGAEFPEATGSEEASRAYRTLKLAFNKMQAVREEQLFFKLELAEEAKSAIGIRKFLFSIYEKLSDYGFDFYRPIKYLILSMIVFGLIFGALSLFTQCSINFFDLPSTNGHVISNCHFSPKWFEFVVVQALPIPGLDKISENAKSEIFSNNAWLSLMITVLVIVQKSLSLLFLFLIGLALKNQFKFK